MKFLIRHSDSLIQVACPGSAEFDNGIIGTDFYAGGIVEADNPCEALGKYTRNTSAACWDETLYMNHRDIEICWGDL